jgi:hypothetical protein
MLLCNDDDGKSQNGSVGQSRSGVGGVSRQAWHAAATRSRLSLPIIQQHILTISIKYAFAQNFADKPFPLRFMRFYGKSTQVAFHEQLTRKTGYLKPSSIRSNQA